MNIARTLIGAAVVATSATLGAAVPEVSDVAMTQNASRLVTITYTLADAPAVVTLDVQTKDDAGAWTSIGGEALWNAAGDVWKKVEAGERTITWRPDLSWPDHKIADGGARAVVTAWALDNTPDYMVVDLAAANTVRYYPAVEFLPGAELGQTGAVTNNPAYKTTKLVLRKVMASGVEWTMGSADGETQRAANETPHQVTLDGNYYIGVFEVTQAQWKNIVTDSSATAGFLKDGAMRPMEQVAYNRIRNSETTSANASYNWPTPPYSKSFLGLLKTKTGIAFDLPSEAQWEFAARAGNGSGYWGDGSEVLNTDTDANLSRLGRYTANATVKDAESNPAPKEGGTAIVGSYAPNAWGLYDMHGNAWEWCLDWYADDIAKATDASGKLYGGRVNIDPANSANYLSGTSASGANRVVRGGSFYSSASGCRAAQRASKSAWERGNNYGFRVVCTAGLE